MIARGKYDLDVVGHYARPDVFSLSINTSAQPPVKFGPVPGNLKARFGGVRRSDAGYGAHKMHTGTEMPRTTTKNAKPTIGADEERRWTAVLARDKSRDGEFFFSVATTGVYCRPLMSITPRQSRRT